MSSFSPISYSDLCKQSLSNYIGYSDLLQTKEWLEKRAVILTRDNYHCTVCGKGETYNDYDDVLRVPFYLWIDKTETRWVKQSDGTFMDYDAPKLEVADKPYHMEVHHKFYIRNRLPWSYDDKDLTTLCNWCHSDYHRKYQVDVFAEDGVTLVKDLLPCLKCHGEGFFEEYKHVSGGVCFRCRGAKYELPSLIL